MQALCFPRRFPDPERDSGKVRSCLVDFWLVRFRDPSINQRKIIFLRRDQKTGNLRINTSWSKLKRSVQIRRWVISNKRTWWRERLANERFNTFLFDQRALIDTFERNWIVSFEQTASRGSRRFPGLKKKNNNFFLEENFRGMEKRKANDFEKNLMKDRD